MHIQIAPNSPDLEGIINVNDYDNPITRAKIQKEILTNPLYFFSAANVPVIGGEYDYMKLNKFHIRLYENIEKYRVTVMRHPRCTSCTLFLRLYMIHKLMSEDHYSMCITEVKMENIKQEFKYIKEILILNKNVLDVANIIDCNQKSLLESNKVNLSLQNELFDNKIFANLMPFSHVLMEPKDLLVANSHCNNIIQTVAVHNFRKIVIDDVYRNTSYSDDIILYPEWNEIWETEQELLLYLKKYVFLLNNDKDMYRKEVLCLDQTQTTNPFVQSMPISALEYLKELEIV